MTKRGRDVRRNHGVLLQIDKGEAHPKKHVCFDKRKKSLGIFFYTSTSQIFCCRSLCIAPVQLLSLCVPQVGLVHVQHTPEANACLWVKKQNHWFSREKGKLLSQIEHTWNWNVRKTNAALRHWQRENWNIFENIWKKSKTPQRSVFLEWTIDPSHTTEQFRA